MSLSDMENDEGGWFDDVVPVKRKKRERTGEKAFCRLCRVHGILQRKLQDLGDNGYPDRTVFLGDGRTCCIEFKQVGKKPEKDQLSIHKQLRSFGVPVLVTSSAREALEWVLSLKSGNRGPTS